MATEALQIDALWSGLNNPATGLSYGGAIVATFAADGSTPKAVWEDKEKTLPSSSGKFQFTLDSNGQAEIFADGVYVIKVYAPTDTLLSSPLMTFDGLTYLNSSDGSILGVSSIAALRAGGGGDFDKQVIHVLGYYLPSENRDWHFQWNEYSTTADDNGVNIKVTSITTGRWERLFEGNTIYDSWFGVELSSPTDRTTELQNTIDFAETFFQNGATVKAGEGTNLLSSTITITGDNIFLEGVGQGYNQSGVVADSTTAATIFEWTGASGEAMINFGPLTNAEYGIKGGGVSKVYLDGKSLAGRGLYTRAAYASKFEQITVSECTVAGVDANIDLSLTIDPGTQQTNIYDQITVIHQTLTSGDCFRLSGDTTYNPSLNYFGVLKLLHRDGDGLQVGSSDGNYFAYTSMFRHPSGTGNGVVLGGSAISADGACRKNVFGFLQTDDGGLFSQGGVAGPAIDNTVLYYSLGNSSPLPTIGTDSTLTYTTSLGQKFGPTNSAGSFTPVFSFVTPGDISVIYTVQVGEYVREGDMVHIQLNLSLTPTYTTASGIIVISGLPYSAILSSSEASLPINGLIGLTFGAGRTMAVGRVDSNNDDINLISMGSGVTNLFLDTTHLPSGTATTIIMSGTYKAQ